MRLIDATNLERYLRDAGRLAPAQRVLVRELAGGVSNIVLRVDFVDSPQPAVVIKQAREQLRVKEPWFCSPERIWREVAFLQACEELLPKAEHEGLRLGVPRVLWEDRSEYLYAMSAAPASAVTLKSLLLQTTDHTRLAAASGRLLGKLHASSWRYSAVAEAFADTCFFDDLRLDPYFRQLARVHPSLAEPIARLLASLSGNRCCLVHGDFSPKNLLVAGEQLWLIDCEVGHYGDPAFDVGFMLSHLSLKTLYHADEDRLSHDERFALAEAQRATPPVSAFLQHYYRQLAPTISVVELHDLQYRVETCYLALLLARVDGKSPVEYLSAAQRDYTRRYALAKLTLGNEL